MCLATCVWIFSLLVEADDLDFAARGTDIIFPSLASGDNDEKDLFLRPDVRAVSQ